MMHGHTYIKKFIILYHFWTTCFDSLESSSGPVDSFGSVH